MKMLLGLTVLASLSTQAYAQGHVPLRLVQTIPMSNVKGRMDHLGVDIKVSEIAGLKWSDIDWENSTISIARSWVAGNVEDTKTEGSAKPLPMDRDLAMILRQHRERMKKVDSEWIFANPQTGNPYWPDKIREDHLIPAGIAAGIGRVGWHTFRHTYSCLLREHEVDLKVQQALMRHADIRTTMNIYTQAIPRAVREANRRVVRSIMGKKAALRGQ